MHVYGNCLNVINDDSACSVLFLSTPGLFPALRKTLEHSNAPRALKFFCVLETILSCSKSTEHAESLFIALTVHIFLHSMLLLTNCEVHTAKYSDRSFDVRTE